MSSKRGKQHKPGERISVYLNKDLPPHFFEWLSKQDDISAFVLYAMERLYAETGNVNISDILPRRFHFEDTVKRQVVNLSLQEQNPITTVVNPDSNPELIQKTSIVDHIEFEETQSLSNQENNVEDQAKLTVDDIAQIEPYTQEDRIITSQETQVEEEITQNTPQPRWANLEHINPDDF